MLLDKIDEKRLLITLSGEDLILLNVTFKDFDNQNRHSQEFVKNLIVKVEKEFEFTLDEKKILIEAMPQMNGCFVLVTLLAKDPNNPKKFYKIKSPTKPNIFCFNDCESLFRTVEQLYDKQFMIKDSSLVIDNGLYFLVLYLTGTISSKLMAIVSEYGNLIGTGDISAARLFERGKIIINNNAIKKLGENLIT